MYSIYHSIGMDSRGTQQCKVAPYLLAATSQFSVLIGQKMQLTGWHNGYHMCNALCVNTQNSIEFPYCPFPILWYIHNKGMVAILVCVPSLYN